MIIKNEDVFAILNSIANIKNKDMSLVVKYKILLIETELLKQQEIMMPIIRELFMKNGQANENGDIIVNEDKREYVESEMKKLYDTEITIPDIQFTIDEFPNIDYNDLKNFMRFIKQ